MTRSHVPFGGRVASACIQTASRSASREALLAIRLPTLIIEDSLSTKVIEAMDGKTETAAQLPAPVPEPKSSKLEGAQCGRCSRSALSEASTEEKVAGSRATM